MTRLFELGASAIIIGFVSMIIMLLLMVVLKLNKSLAFTSMIISCVMVGVGLILIIISFSQRNQKLGG